MTVRAGSPIYADDVMSSVDVQTFDTSGTWTMPPGAKKVWVRCRGGGGSGAGAGATAAATVGAGGGGQAGGYAESWYDASSLSGTEAIVVGAGGAASTVAGNAGSATTFSTAANQCKGDGGNGGPFLAVSASFGTTPTPTVTQSNVGNALTVRGAAGTYGVRNGPDNSGTGGQGGNGDFGGGGAFGANAAGGAGDANSGGGGGGAGNNGTSNGGSGSARSSGAGGSGRCIVVTYR